MKSTCPSCKGRGHIATTRGKIVAGNGTWFRDDAHPVTINECCPDCHGTGRVDCAICMDAGEIVYGGLTGPEPTIVPCSCARGRLLADVIADPSLAMEAR